MKSIHTFIDEHKEEIDNHIRDVLSTTGHTADSIDDDDRIMWVQNNDDLRKWARKEGVFI